MFRFAVDPCRRHGRRPDGRPMGAADGIYGDEFEEAITGEIA
jgi:hypothetical protein